jgi:hypothetical protein
MMGDMENQLNQLKEKYPEAPVMFQSGLGEILKNLPDKKANEKRKWQICSTVAALFVVGTLSLGFVIPPVGQAFQQIPFLGKVFEHDGDQGLKQAKNGGVISTVDQSVTDHGLTLTISELLYDGSRLSIGYIIHSEHLPKGFITDKMSLSTDGKDLNFSLGLGGQQVDPTTYVGTMKINTTEDLPESFTLNMKISNIGEIHGKWDFSIPVVQMKSQTWLPMITKTAGDTTITVNKVQLAPSATEVRVRVNIKGERVKKAIQNRNTNTLELQYGLFDDKGNQLNPLGSGNGAGGHAQGSEETSEQSWLFEPLKNKPQYLILRPIKPDIPSVENGWAKQGDGSWWKPATSTDNPQYIPDLEVKIPLTN